MHRLALPSLSAFFLLLFGSIILYSSVYSVNRSLTNQSADRLISQEWYWGSTVLPDHPLYPALMVRDKFVLVITPKEEQSNRRFEYARARFDTATKLAQKGNLPLAISTLSKSQQYMLDATVQARELGYVHQPATMVYQQLDVSLYKLSQFIEKHPEANTPFIQSLSNASKAELILLQNLALSDAPPSTL